ncbi:MAG TPA: PEP-CTERM sorting domain-containing protein [Thermodesulfobacteriaceae bacterium]|nr:PEP-CTERM sorting domain-containing protein [Thermodesulfobacteriaceae bacterium]
MNTDKLVTILAAAGFFFMSLNAWAYTIDDNYTGASPTGSGWQGADVIGYAGYFDSDRIEVTYNGSWIYIDVYSRYLDNIGQFQTELGDLFLATGGWNPYGDQPYVNDNYNNTGTNWNYALVLDNHLPGAGQISGSFELFSFDQGSPVLSWAPAGYIYRDGQLVQFQPDANAAALAVGLWSINNLGGQDEDDHLRFALNYSFGEIPELAIHWAMSCGNDVVEGSVPAAPVPEPATVLILGSGLLGLGSLRKRQRKTT